MQLRRKEREEDDQRYREELAKLQELRDQNAQEKARQDRDKQEASQSHIITALPLSI